jgi:cytochrome c oxidase cbb3-type subunit II
MKHEKIETHAGLLIILTLIVISIGGLVEIVPLFYIKNTVETVKVNGIETIHPYTPLQLAGRDLYQREGCYLCHSQMIRPFRDEKLRYGHYSLAAESQYDHPFQWGSKRIGPDLARVGHKYSNAWMVQHLIAPRSVVPESIMPDFPWLLKDNLRYNDIAEHMRSLREAGVPYSLTETEYQANLKRFGKKVADMLDINRAEENLLKEEEDNNYDGVPGRVTEMDAMVAYLQVLGTMVDFSKFEDGHFAKFR